MKNIAGLAIFMTVLTFSSASYSQCNVKVATDATRVGLDAAFERLYRNEDLENGLFSISGFNTFIYDKGDMSLHVRHIITVFVSTSGSKKEIIPRQLEMHFKNGEKVRVSASTISDPIYVERAKSISCSFVLSDSETLKVMDNKLSSITISDNRTGQSFKFSPYDLIFQEQIDCILIKANQM